MARTMGLGGLAQDICFKRKFRWMLNIPDVAGDFASANAEILPPLKSARPNVAFKEMQAEHLNETLFYPSKPEYKPITITLYDLKQASHPVLLWIASCFRAEDGAWFLATERQFIRDVRLELYDGCGNTMETWVYENAWPQQIDFGDMDMSSSDLVTCDITLRYARAYIELR